MLVSECCGVGWYIYGGKPDKATYDGITLIMGYCAECKRSTLFKEKKGERMLVSECCGAIPLTDTYENMGKCRKCKEDTEFYEEEE